MRIQIRKGVFETNSSSTHAIVIGGGVWVEGIDGKLQIVNHSSNTDIHNLPKHIHFGRGAYGWEFKRYETIEERAAYLWTAIVKCVFNNIEEIDAAKKFIQDSFAEVGIETSFDEYELVNETYNFSDKPYNFSYVNFVDNKNDIESYINHGYDTKLFVKCVLNDKDALYSYIISNYSYVATGNDNEDPEDPDHYIRYNGYGEPRAIFNKGN